MSAMSRPAAEYEPDEKARRVHDARFAAFQKLQAALKDARNA
ncbi:hypothetical protein [Paracoccus benzoatiresistens]|uniref:Uncharacterized protein n=1 Tax=Paracoccus benzoatiresistens TaxID=2997341 RepID=A0ABT4J881_9RHOB|nr:hypothetical protein [Paracoccus sp. EF6]MCZ0962543.1 hypothetical protein [Paracoccus sp. EF6]